MVNKRKLSFSLRRLRRYTLRHGRLAGLLLLLLELHLSLLHLLQHLLRRLYRVLVWRRRRLFGFGSGLVCGRVLWGVICRWHVIRLRFWSHVSRITRALNHSRLLLLRYLCRVWMRLGCGFRHQHNAR